MPAYTGLIEVPRAGVYWIDGYVDRTASGETFIRGELAVYEGAQPRNRAPLPEPIGEMATQPGFWPLGRRKR